MSTIIGVMGQSGSGKTTALRTLNPDTTFFIDADRKGLSWRGWKKQYRSVKGNYARESDPAKVREWLQRVDKDMPQIKAVIVDTVNGIMIDDEMKRMKENGYDKWIELACSVFDMISESNMFRDDLFIIYCFHAEDVSDEDGSHFIRFLTSGRKLQKIQLETKFPIVLLALNHDGDYVFQTQARNSTAKSPMGLFGELEIKNDMNFVLTKLKEYQDDDGDLTVTDYEDSLMELMSDDSIAPYIFNAYCVEKKFLKDGQNVVDLRPDIAEKMVKNWKKIRAKLVKKDNPNIDEADISDAAKEVRVLMELSGVTKLEITGYMLEKKFIKGDERWFDAGDKILKAIAKQANWDKATTKMKG